MPLKKARLQISDYNDKRKARVKKQEKRILMASLSLTSMVDMFAILVIFLLSNATTVTQWIEVSHKIELPRAKFADPPPKAATLQIARSAIYGDTQLLTQLSDPSAPVSMEAVKSWLSKKPKKDGYVNVVAHQKLPFGLIKRIIAACQDSGFKNVNLAVQPKG